MNVAMIAEQPGDIWVFAYGSLMWNPQFDHLGMAPALLRGYHRAFCVYSHVWRGTRARPGLVLGLDSGGSCKGQVFLVAAAGASDVIGYLDRRERVTEVYLRRSVPIKVTPAEGDPIRVMAYAYVVDRGHHQYAGKLPPDQAAALILQGRGKSGANHEYLASTVIHLDQMGIKESPLHLLEAKVRGLMAAEIKD